VHVLESCDGSSGQMNDRGNVLFRIHVEAGRNHYALRKMAYQADFSSVESSLLCYTPRRLAADGSSVVRRGTNDHTACQTTSGEPRTRIADDLVAGGCGALHRADS
jgi:hypothetical protein